MECTPASLHSPKRCRAPPLSSFSNTLLRTGLSRTEPVANPLSILTISWSTTRPAPMFWCPTSLLPMMPSGRPTSSPCARISVRGQLAERLLQNGSLASFTALYLSSEASWFSPQPSLITNITGLLTPFILISFEKVFRQIKKRAAIFATIILQNGRLD